MLSPALWSGRAPRIARNGIEVALRHGSARMVRDNFEKACLPGVVTLRERVADRAAAAAQSLAAGIGGYAGPGLACT